jgi:hypothetical protein
MDETFQRKAGVTNSFSFFRQCTNWKEVYREKRSSLFIPLRMIRIQKFSIVAEKINLRHYSFLFSQKEYIYRTDDTQSCIIHCLVINWGGGGV